MNNSITSNNQEGPFLSVDPNNATANPKRPRTTAVSGNAMAQDAASKSNNMNNNDNEIHNDNDDIHNNLIQQAQKEYKNSTFDVNKPTLTSTRKRSFFASNHGIHALTLSILQNSKMNTNNNDNNTETAVNNSQPKSQNGNETFISNGKQKENDDDEEEEIIITSSNTTNAIVDYPHPRYLCGLNSFQKNAKISSSLLPDATATATSAASTNVDHCPNCYCYICDIPASQCQSWGDKQDTTSTNNTDMYNHKQYHCNAHDKEKFWVKKRLDFRKKHGLQVGIGQNSSSSCCSDSDSDGDTCISNSDLDSDEGKEEGGTNEVIVIDSDDDNDNDTNGINNNFVPPIPMKTTKNDINDMMNDYEHHYYNKDRNNEDLIGNKSRKDARIMDVLSHNLREIELQSTLQHQQQQQKQGEEEKMQGDIPQLNLQQSFFVEGVRIGWPYPMVMPPQRQMAMHLIKAFKNRRHVVLESPTGTGKSAAILCAALAWQRYNAKIGDPLMSNTKTKIIYCSRTHSQVAQMVQSLKKTPYRPKMAILGSRDRMCIHHTLRPRSIVEGGTGETKWNVSASKLNLQCRIRVRNTEKVRGDFGKIKTTNNVTSCFISIAPL